MSTQNLLLKSRQTHRAEHREGKMEPQQSNTTELYIKHPINANTTTHHLPAAVKSPKTQVQIPSSLFVKEPEKHQMEKATQIARIIRK